MFERDILMLYQELKEYTPFDEVEAENVKSFINFIDVFSDNIWTRENVIGHVCASAWVVDKTRSKVLMAYHNIYKSFAWLGGHADGDKDLLEAAKREVCEESGLKSVKVLNEGKIFDVNVQFVVPHIKRGKHITAHLHLSIVYLFEANVDDELSIREDENSAVEWIEKDKLFEKVEEEHMKPIYSRLMKKVEQL